MIEVKNVSKTLKKNRVLKDISYTFEDGRIYGIHGRNGCGKTMLLRALAGLLVPDEGHIIVNGEELHRDISFPPDTGVIIEHMELLPQYSACDNLKILSRIRKKADEDDIRNALEAVGLDPDSRRKVRKFSLGMKQRLNIAQAVFEGQRILLLDEPMNAIDEKGISMVYRLLREKRDGGATVIVASHHREDLSGLCDAAVRIEEGAVAGD